MKLNSLSFLMLVSLVTGNMIGSGVFFLPTLLAPYGVVALIAWFCTAIGAFFLALVFANYAREYVAIGGPYAYCRDAYGDFIGFQTAYNYWFALWVGNAAAVVALVSYLGVFFPILLSNKLFALALSLAIIWILTAINLYGVALAGLFQIITTFLKIIPLAMLILFGMSHIELSHFEIPAKVAQEGYFVSLSQAGALTLWTFLGVESATVPPEYVENPNKLIPYATMIGVMITLFFYLGSAFVVMGTLPASALEHSNAPYADAAILIFGQWGFYLVAFGAVIASLGSLNGIILLQGQIPYAASLDGLFPKLFSTETKHGSPKAALIISAFLISCLLCFRVDDSLIDKFTFIVKLAIFATLIPYLFSSIGLLLFFKQKLTKRRIVIAVGAFLYSLWAVIGSGKETVYLGAIVFFIGLPIYFWIKQDAYSD